MAGQAMAGTRVDYRAASGGAAWWVAADGGAVAVLSPTVSAVTAAAVWRGLGAGGIGAVLDALTGAFGTSLTAIPPFALAVVEPGGLRVAVRGDIEIIVEADAAESVSGAGVATWTERFVAGATRATVTPAPSALAPDADVPLRSGVVLADAVRLDIVRPDTVHRDHAAPAHPAEPSPGTAADAPVAAAESPSAADAPVAAAPASPAEHPAPAAPTASPVATVSPAPAASVIDALPPEMRAAPRTTPEDDLRGAPAPTIAQDDEAAAVPPAVPDTSADTLIPEATASESEPPPADEYDLLWGETVVRPVSAAAIADPAADPDVSAPTGADRAVPEADGVLAPDLGDHDGETIAVADLRAMRAERAGLEDFESTDNVPPRRPARGRIRLSTGRVVELERPVVIGRRPKSTRTSGADLPTLVAVDSPEQDISRSHVEIRAEGEHVLVIDLDTTNGTILLRGGHEPVRLHPGEPTMVVTGDVLDLGDEVTVTFEDLP